MEWLFSLLFTLTGATVTEDGHVIDRKQKELEKLECIYTNRECANKLKHNKKYIYFEDVKGNK